MVAEVDMRTIDAFTVKVTLLLPAGTVTLEGTLAAALLLESVTCAPPAGAGPQSSTGTVTLSGPAPAGGAQVTLSSSNAAATVPSSVTVPAASTTATFTIITSAVAASTPVTISASYGGTSTSASLTVTPPPLPTVSSLTLNPTSVTGGTQSSTGTVPRTAAPPAGGAQVTLSSSNA